jgi:hypothetical protein
MDTDRRGLTPHRREHWGVEDPEDPEAAVDVLETPEETRVEAKRLLWRDSAIILVGIVLALLVAQFLPRSDPGLAADATDLSTGPGAGGTLSPGGSAEPAATFGPIVDPGLGIDATRPPRPGVTLPPTGTFEPRESGGPTPRPTKKPPATLAPPTPAPTPSPTPEITPEITPIPPPTVSITCDVIAPLTVSCTSSTENIQGASESWDMDGPGTAVSGGDGSGSINFLYDAPGSYSITLTVTGLDGSKRTSEPAPVEV